MILCGRTLRILYQKLLCIFWHLYNKFKHKNFEKFRFVDPYGVGPVSSTNNEQTFIDAQISRRARVLTNRLVGTHANQLCVVPCNTGGHWILTIINPHKDEICLFDPLHEGIDDDDTWKDVDMALKMFNAETMANKPKKKELRYGKSSSSQRKHTLEIKSMKCGWSGLNASNMKFN
ncbi:hypothetical protein ACS0TY_009742 [Phlomoides rotata]